MSEATLMATLYASPNGELASLPAAVRWLEARADLAGDLDPDGLRGRFPGERVYSLRSRAEGGAFEGPPAERRRRLLAAARRWDVIELEAARDLEPELLAAVPPHRRLVSWHGPAAGLDGLRRIWERMATVEARLYRLAPAAADPEEALAPLRLLAGLGRRDVLAFATGAAGAWTRVLAPRLGAPVVCGSCGRLAGDGEGEPTVAQLVSDYGLPALPPVRDLFGIVGRSAGRSLSPRLHNAAYRALGVEALYLPFPAEGFTSFWRAVVAGLDHLGWPLRGLTVTSPHKEEALALAGEASPLARRAGAANTLLRHNGSWRADTADAEGVVAALGHRRIPLAGRRTAVVGCGGAGRAAAAGLQRAGADVTLVNRGDERGRYAARLLGLPFVPLADWSPAGFSLVVHATPLAAEPPFEVAALCRGATVVELVYGAGPTALVQAARAGGGVVIDGREVLLVEARRQFRMMTGRTMPAGPARALIGT